MSETKIIKINNPLYVANLVPLITDFLDKVTLPNINVHSMVAYFQRTSQLGGELIELWSVFDDNEPVGFSHWCIVDIPWVGSCHLDFIYCKGNRRESVKQLITEFINFGIKHHSPWYMLEINNVPKLISHFENVYKELGFEQCLRPCLPFTLRRK